MDAIDQTATARALLGSAAKATSATSFRFVLLAFAATAAVASTANWLLPWAFGAYGNTEVNAANECQRSVYSGMVDIARSESSWDVWRSDGPFHEQVARLEECPSVATSWVFPLIGVVGFWLIVLGVLRWLPAWRIRSRGYRPLLRVTVGEHREGEDHAAVLFNRLARLQEQAGVATPVAYLRDGLNPRAHALAFGRTGHRCIVLAGGLDSVLRKTPDDFDAIVLHELAHLRNRDIDIGFLTIIAWRVAMPLVVATWALVTLRAIGSETTTDVLPFAARALQSLLLAVVALLLRNSVLRSRELFADARVSEWTSLESVDSMLKAHFPMAPTRHHLLWTHPAPSRRSAALYDPHLLTATSTWVWFAMGLVTKILMANIASSGGNTWTTSGVPAFTFAAVIVLAGFAIEVSRGCDRSAPAGLTRSGTGRKVAFGLGLGLAIGFVLFEPVTVLVALWAGDLFVLQYVLWVPILCGAAWLGYRWIAAVGDAWAPVLEDRWGKPSIWLCRGVLALAVVPVYVGLKFVVTLPTQSVIAPLVDADGVISALAVFVELPLRFVLYSHTDTGPMLLILIALPLVAESIRHDRRSLTGYRWRQRRRLRTGVRQGLWKGAWYGLAAPLLGLIGIVVFLPSKPAPLALIVLFDGIVAMVAAACAAHLGYRCAHRPHPIATAALGAFTVGCVYLCLLLLWMVVFGNSDQASSSAANLNDTVRALWYPVPAGVALGTVAATLTRLAGRRRPDPSLSAVSMPVGAEQQCHGAPSIEAATLGRQDAHAPADDQVFTPWRHVRTGLAYGAIGAVAMLIGLCLNAFSILVIGPVVQIVCAVRVVRKHPGGPHPIGAAALAAIVAGITGQILMVLPSTVAIWGMGESPNSALAWLPVSTCPVLIGTLIATLSARITLNKRASS